MWLTATHVIAYAQTVARLLLPGRENLTNGIFLIKPVKLVVTNKIKSVKDAKIKEANWVAMEIDLRDVDRTICREKLETIIIQDCARKRMIIESKESLEPVHKGNNWIVYLLLIILGTFAICTIGKWLKRTVNRRKKQQHKIPVVMYGKRL
jgi:hypothetical protein